MNDIMRRQQHRDRYTDWLRIALAIVLLAFPMFVGAHDVDEEEDEEEFDQSEVMIAVSADIVEISG